MESKSPPQAVYCGRTDEWTQVSTMTTPVSRRAPPHHHCPQSWMMTRWSLWRLLWQWCQHDSAPTEQLENNTLSKIKKENLKVLTGFVWREIELQLCNERVDYYVTVRWSNWNMTPLSQRFSLNFSENLLNITLAVIHGWAICAIISPRTMTREVVCSLVCTVSGRTEL